MLELYEHQKKAVRNLKSGSILCGGVGTGKSRTAIAYFYTRVCGGKLPYGNTASFEKMRIHKRLYIITTARKRDIGEWDSEISPFIGLEDYVVDSWNNIKKYIDVENSFFIFDEQRLVGNGMWVNSFYKIAKKNKWILLSATPGDTWMDYIPVFVANGFYRNKTEFVRRHVVYSPYVKFPKVMKYLEVGILRKHLNEIKIDMEYEKIATQHHQWVKVDYDEVAYSKVMKTRWNVYEDCPIRNYSELCYILRKISNSGKGRIEAVKDIFGKHPRLIIFYNFDYELEALRDFLETEKILYSEWNGHKHQKIPTSYSWIYLVQYNAGAEGWNCTATDGMIFYSQNYSYRITHQASGRIDRMNTSYTDLYYYHLFSDSSMDKAIAKCLKKKKDFNERNLFASNTRPIMKGEE